MIAIFTGSLALLITALMLYAMLIDAPPVQAAPVSPLPGPVVAVIDSGINLSHAHFEGIDIETFDATSTYSDEGMDDNCLHGTPVAGLVVSQNPDAKLLVIKATNECFAGYSAMYQGIRYAVDHGARVVTLSLGGDFDLEQLHDAVIYARQSGVLVVASAGNSGDDTTPTYPAWYDEVAAVAGWDFPNSSYGPFVDLSAPGLRVRAPVGSLSNYARMTGTSVSAPVVAGMASYIWAQRPELSLAGMEAVLYGSLVDIAPPGYDVYTGFGRVDERRLHRALGIVYLDVPWLITDNPYRGSPARLPVLEGEVMLEDLPVTGP